MKRILLAAFLLLPAMLCGCNSTDLPDSQDGEYDSKQESTSSEDKSESVPGSQSGESEPEVIPIPSGEIILKKDELFTVSSDNELVIADGETLFADGKILCQSGGRIVIESGGSLLLNGEIDLGGELIINGFLGLSDSASVYGEGQVYLKSFDDIDCRGRFTAAIVPPERVVENGVTTIGGVVIVNKKITLSPEFGNGLDSGAAEALERMRQDSGFSMEIISGFRDYYLQKRVFEGWCNRDGIEAAETYSARPGHSEHQTGFTVDITQIDSDYADTPEGRWVAENSYKYGFIVRYPLGKHLITGYIYEPWHLRYLGESTARLVHDSGLTLEEFLGVEGGDYSDSYEFS